tara:strand:- start:49 stop:498 length:450 start_codon:yes stop_codon:yes gene_type:complete
MSSMEADELLIAHEAIHAHHERRLTDHIDRRQLNAGKMLQLRLKVRNVLKKTKFFSGFNMKIVSAIVEKMHHRTFDEGSRICVQGDLALEFFIVTKGIVSVHQTVGKGGEFALETEIATCNVWDCVGETALLQTDSVRTASCTATKGGK